LIGRFGVDAEAVSPVRDWNDMVVRVKGIGEKSAAKFSEGSLTVNGTATEATAAKAASAVKGGAAVVKEDVK
jgi:competence protein ComEA